MNALIVAPRWHLFSVKAICGCFWEWIKSCFHKKKSSKDIPELHVPKPKKTRKPRERHAIGLTKH